MASRSWTDARFKSERGAEADDTLSLPRALSTTDMCDHDRLSELDLDVVVQIISLLDVDDVVSLRRVYELHLVSEASLTGYTC